NWRAWKFNGVKGQIIDAYAQGLNGTDTVIYLYKLSRLTGRPYDRPVAYNDDTEQTGWSLQKAPSNPYSSSIIGAVLPEDRDYALVVTTYHQSGGPALLKVHSHGAVSTTIPPFAASGSTGTPLSFTDEQNNSILRAVEYP